MLLDAKVFFGFAEKRVSQRKWETRFVYQINALFL